MYRGKIPTDILYTWYGDYYPCSVQEKCLVVGAVSKARNEPIKYNTLKEAYQPKDNKIYTIMK